MSDLGSEVDSIIGRGAYLNPNLMAPSLTSSMTSSAQKIRGFEHEQNLLPLPSPLS